jgi:hypothetical protein
MFGMCNSEATGAYSGSHSNHSFLSDASYCTGASNVADNSQSSVDVTPAPSYNNLNSDGRTNDSKYEPSQNNAPTSHSPSGIVSDNGLHYANLDGSTYPPSSYHHHAVSQVGYTHYSDPAHSDTPLTGIPSSSFSAYLDHPNSVQYSSSPYPPLYHQSKIRAAHDYSTYPHVPKPSSAVPTYKWMQVKRNVPKPGKVISLCIPWPCLYCVSL